MENTIGFIYRGPHHIHADFARSIDADFINNWLLYKYKRIPIFLIPISFLIRLITLPKRDVYLCEDGYSLVLAYCKKLLSPNIKIMIIMASPFYYDFANYKSYKKKVYQNFMDNVDYAFAVSNMLKESAKKYLKCPISVTNPYVDTKIFQKIVDIKNSNLCFIGQVSIKKGVDIILKSFKEVKKNFPKIKLNICGPIKDKIYGINNEGIILSKTYVDPRPFIKNSLIFLFMPERDSFSTAVIEAMSAGLIPIVSNTTGSTEAVSKISNNLIIKRNSKCLTEKIIEILNLSFNEKQKLSKQAMSAANDYSKEKMIRGFKKTFEKAINECYSNSKEKK